MNSIEVLVSVSRNTVEIRNTKLSIEEEKTLLKESLNELNTPENIYKYNNLMIDIDKMYPSTEMFFDGNAMELLEEFNEKCCGLKSTERSNTTVSKSEMRRWFDRNQVCILGRKGIKPNEKVGIFYGLVLHPKGRKITLL